jgi:hypothetical protein
MQDVKYSLCRPLLKIPKIGNRHAKSSKRTEGALIAALLPRAACVDESSTDQVEFRVLPAGLWLITRTMSQVLKPGSTDSALA